ncbi:ABC transporter ATP-binding protein [Motiliproteus sp. MSK22-1]|uniref:ABC transporter ATP-binding protein n=1 Tax=Motiliproteus sp. MSK22-1 TaxID=1897630 RepID=UPI0009758D6F|nr:ABC transporter ATP-binding protein [Motiliproteus sp. MSK22-1]OMH37962.1 Fe3+/spermidine/putrescine ABC transporter ATP-binding protein [Motiliproteus sp. MSK22-1]
MYNKNFIEFIGVQKSYDGENLVIPHLDLCIRQGEFLTFLGASGSGKTTTLMMLAGFEIPTKGQILMNSQPIQDVPAHKRGMGMVFQNYALFPHMTVEENLAYPLKMRGLNRTDIDKKVKAAMAKVHLENMGKRKPLELSGGQQQRVALARALVFEPELILMDEPLGALDKNLREHMQYEIKQLHQELGVTVVYVTHDQSEALTMSDRVAVFNNGRIEQIASPDKIYDLPNSPYIAGFIGENNALKGSLQKISGTTHRVDLGEGVSISLNRNVDSCLSPAADKPVTVMIRPEHIHLQTSKHSDEVTLSCTITDKVYLGDHTRLIGRLKNGNTIVAKIIDDLLTDETLVGNAVEFGCSEENILLFPGYD